MDKQDINDTIRVLFHQSLVKRGIKLNQLPALLSAYKGELGEEYTYRVISCQSRIGTEHGSKKPNVSLLRRLAELPFFWNPAENRYWSVAEINALIKGEWDKPPSEIVIDPLGSLKTNYDEILRNSKLLPRSQRFQLVKELMESIDPYFGEDAMINLSLLGNFRLPSLLTKSLISLGYGQDYLAAAKSVAPKLNGASPEEFAACLKAIALRSPTSAYNFRKDVALCLAALCCKVEAWGSDLEEVLINPNQTYAGDVEGWLSILNAATVTQLPTGGSIVNAAMS